MRAQGTRRATARRARVIRQTPAAGASRRGGQEIILRVR
jgi:beta-lactam-binding protein with PASTA domain